MHDPQRQTRRTTLAVTTPHLPGPDPDTIFIMTAVRPLAPSPPHSPTAAPMSRESDSGPDPRHKLSPWRVRAPATAAPICIIWRPVAGDSSPVPVSRRRR